MAAPARSNTVQVEREHEKYRIDSKYEVVDGSIGCCSPKIYREGDDLCLQFSSDWMWKMMYISSNSQVPFNFYGAGNPVIKKDRSYPRAAKTSIFIGDRLRENDDKYGGRLRFDATEGSAEYYQEFQNDTEESLALSDLMIWYKRGFTQKVIDGYKNNGFLYCENRAKAHKNSQTALHDYPMLCVYFGSGNTEWLRAYEKGYARIAQIYFTARLNNLLLSKKCIMEVVAREGFGSFFPTTSDLGDGFRFDPGFLPLEYVTEVIKALKDVSEFFSELIEKEAALFEKWKGAAQDYKAKLIGAAKNLDGNDSGQLIYIDQCIFALSAEMANNQLSFDDCVKLISKPETKKNPPLRELYSVCYKMQINTPAIKTDPKIKKQKTEEDGYGSESDDEFEGPAVKIVIRKAAFISGMAALQIINELARQYTQSDAGPLDKLNRQEEAGKKIHAYYYFECMKLREHPDVAHYNMAPNPKNYSAAPVPAVGEFVVLTVDATNASVADKAALIDTFIEKGPTAKQLLILEESGSKHPTGGDVVCGVIRCIGTKAATADFFALLKKHLDDDGGRTSVLDKAEHEFRKALKQHHLITRNRDIVAYYKHLKAQK